MTAPESALLHVLLLEPNAALRSAIQCVLDAEGYQVDTCDSLDQVLGHSDPHARPIALVAWQSMQGLLVEGQRQRLGELNHRLRLVVMVPRRWLRLLQQTDLAQTLAGIVAKPFEADELVRTLQQALSIPSPTA